MKPLLSLRRSSSQGLTHSTLPGGSDARKHRSYLPRDGRQLMPALVAVSVFAALVFLGVQYASPASAQAAPSGRPSHLACTCKRRL